MFEHWISHGFIGFSGFIFLVEHFFGGLTSDVSSPENPMNEAPKTSSECDLQASNYSLYNLASKKTNWLVVLTILKNINYSMGMILPYIMENKNCSKPPTR